MPRTGAVYVNGVGSVLCWAMSRRATARHAALHLDLQFAVESSRALIRQREREVIARGIFTSTTDLRRKLMQNIRLHNKTCRRFSGPTTTPRTASVLAELGAAVAMRGCAICFGAGHSRTCLLGHDDPRQRTAQGRKGDS